MTTFESTIRQINYPQQNVYNKLSDLSNLQALKERYELMKDTMPEEARQQAEKSEQSPIPFNFWIQLLPVTSTTSKMKLTIKAELNMFIKQMVKKPLQEGIEKIADVLQMIQY